MFERQLRCDVREQRPALAQRHGHDRDFDEIDQVVLQEQTGCDAAAEEPDVGCEILLAHALAQFGGGLLSWGVVGSVVAGLIAGVIIGQSTEYYTSDEYSPTQGIAKAAEMGPATTIIDGLATGMYSTGVPVITIVVGIIAAFGFAGGFADPNMGLYGVGFAAVGAWGPWEHGHA